jgi:hypothetical protein
MRLTAALLTLACLAACGGVQTVSERSLARDDEWRQRQAELDAQAIRQGRHANAWSSWPARGADRGSRTLGMDGPELWAVGDLGSRGGQVANTFFTSGVIAQAPALPPLL